MRNTAILGNNSTNAAYAKAFVEGTRMNGSGFLAKVGHCHGADLSGDTPQNDVITKK